MTPSTSQTPASLPSSPMLARVGLLVVVLIWGINFSVVKHALLALDPLVLNALRFLLAGLALWALPSRKTFPRLERGDFARIALLGIVGNTAYQLAFIFGLDQTLAGNGAIILASAPVWTVLLAVLVGQDQGTAGLLAATALGAAGIALVMSGSGAELGVGGGHLRGDILVGISSVCWAAYTVAGRDLVTKYGALPVTTWALWIGGAPLVLAGVPGAFATPWGQIGLAIWLDVVFAALGAVALAYVLWYRGVEKLGSSRTALWSNLVPCVALVVAWGWLGERPKLLQVAGMGVVLLSVLLARATRPAPKRVGGP
ncbi:MAG: DMT family transporter [Longimicrobiales bacterium]